MADDDGGRTDCDALATNSPNQLCSATIGIDVASRSAGKYSVLPANVNDVMENER